MMPDGRAREGVLGRSFFFQSFSIYFFFCCFVCGKKVLLVLGEIMLRVSFSCLKRNDVLFFQLTQRGFSSTPPLSANKMKNPKPEHGAKKKKQAQNDRIIKKHSLKVHRVYSRLMEPFYGIHFPVSEPIRDHVEVESSSLSSPSSSSPSPSPPPSPSSPTPTPTPTSTNETQTNEGGEKKLLLGPQKKKRVILTPQEQQEKIALRLFNSGNCRFREAIGPKKFSEMSSIESINEEEQQERDKERKRLIQGGERVEIAFAGRSNVGKSSLLNALFGTKENFARTSKTPGRTQTLNFYDVGKILTLVDMPGYGYANAPIKLVGEWHEMVARFMLTRPRLCHTFLLIDCRRGLGSPDINLLDSLNEMKVSHQIVLTKVDRISFTEASKLTNQLNVETRVRGGTTRFPILATSSKHQFGMFPVHYEIMGKMREYGAFD